MLPPLTGSILQDVCANVCVCCLLQVSEELKQHLNLTITENYAQPGKEDITLAVDRLQQDVCAGCFGVFLGQPEPPV